MQPYSVIQAGCKLEDGTALGALQKTRSRFTDSREAPLACMRGSCRGSAPSERACASLKKCALRHIARRTPLQGPVARALLCPIPHRAIAAWGSTRVALVQILKALCL